MPHGGFPGKEADKAQPFDGHVLGGPFHVGHKPHKKLRKNFFFEKKKQKTFVRCRGPIPGIRVARIALGRCGLP
jgi:hypothetical protein